MSGLPEADLQPGGSGSLDAIRMSPEPVRLVESTTEVPCVDEQDGARTSIARDTPSAPLPASQGIDLAEAARRYAAAVNAVAAAQAALRARPEWTALEQARRRKSGLMSSLMRQYRKGIR